MSILPTSIQYYTERSNQGNIMQEKEMKGIYTGNERYKIISICR